jgi:hypothetical protein
MSGPVEEDAEAADDCAWCGHAAEAHSGLEGCAVIVANRECACEGYLAMTETEE